MQYFKGFVNFEAVTYKPDVVGSSPAPPTIDFLLVFYEH